MFANSRDQRNGMGVKWGTSFAKDRVQGPRFDEKGHLFGVQKMEHDELQNSRNLWVGNVSQHVTETVLAEQFSRFGEVESITIYSSRNYAFVNFRKEEDAVIAKRSLQGLVLGGLALRIEFAKGDSHPSSSVPHTDDLTRFRDERRFSDMAGLSGTRDSRILSPNSEASFSEKHKGDRNAEPSEVLWIGFPAYMKVDELSLRRVFSPFGEIENVTTFPGRTYAFVQFRSVVAACRAKEALQGKLFNNPRVNICFSKSEVGPVEHGRNLTNGSLPFSHKVISNSGVGSKAVENVREERHQGITSGGLCLPNASFGPNTDRMLSSSNGNLISRSNSVRPMSAVSKIGSAYDDIRPTRIGSEMGVAKDVSDLPMNSPRVERSSFWRSNGLDKSRGGGSYYEDMWDSSSDDVSSRDVKRARFAPVSRSDSSDLPFSEQGRDMQHFCSPRTGAMNPGSESYKFSRFSVGSDNDVGASHCSHNLISENTRHPNRSSQQLDGPWIVPNNFESGIVSTIPPLDSGKWDGSVSETHHGPLNEEWKWQGTIAKGGTPVCRARCFPVGKVLDVTLPEFLNCTARTGLDMLATHFNKAGSVGVVFFVPESDPDIAPYNEFMHYLGEKQRAAVTKLGEGTTLFLVPPSQFSEQVLKVPGKVSISGVILKFDQPNSGHGLPHHPSSELVNAQPHPFLHRPSVTNGIPMHEDDTHSKPPSPLPPQRYASHGNSNFYTEHYQAPNTSFSPVQSLPPSATAPVVYQAHGSGTSSSSSFEGNMNATVVNDNIHHNISPQNQVSASPWSTLNQDRSHVPNSIAITYASDTSSFIMPSQPGFSSAQQVVTVQQQQQPSFSLAPNPEQQSVGVANNATLAGPGDQNQLLRHPMPPVPGNISLQSGHLAQLANLLGQQSQSAPLSVSQSLQDNQQKLPPPTPQTAPNFCSVPQTNFHIQPNVPLPLPSSQFSYGQQAQQQTSQQGMLPRTGNLSDVRIAESLVPDNQKQNDGREETEADPQKRLQATLQLAAALLQQIQQQSKGGDQQ